MAKNYFDKELVITKEDDESFVVSTKYWTCDNNFLVGDVEVRGHCHITAKYGSASQGDCNINVSLNFKILIVCYNLKKYVKTLSCKNLKDLILK